MANGLTAKQLAFCKHYAKNPTTAGAVAAYRTAYKPRSSDETVKRAAMRLLKHPPVVDFLELTRLKAADRAALSLEEHLDKLAEIRDRAMEDGMYAAAHSCERSRGQAVGLYVDRSAVKVEMSVSSELERARERVRSGG